MNKENSLSLTLLLMNIIYFSKILVPLKSFIFSRQIPDYDKIIIAKNMKFISLPKNQEIKHFLQIGFILWLGEILLLIFSWSFLPSRLPFFYSKPWGEEQLAAPAILFLLPALGLVIFFINSLISTLMPKEEKLMRQILSMAFLVFNFLSLVTLIQIIRLII